MASILTDPQNSERSAEEVATLCIEALDDARARTHRLAVVGQIQYEAPGPVHTVVLGPFSCRGLLDTEEKFRGLLTGPVGAREIGQDLAYDPASKTGRGRFLLAPAFFKARDAWAFYKGAGPAEVVADALPLLPRDIVPVCSCGLKARPQCRWCGQAAHHPCPLHEPEAQTHRCRQAA
ncbi:hypothetical protein ACFPM3_20095 [Streptomyces coeruleoprunus]|uniref:Uncharacterized protein n=1 Tax=Streptomyces coeruleoprunus TaxID=285563 RepID=A0ABV9XJX5_9ACTN